MALALYRRYRPGTFAEVVGQEHVTDPLRTALAAGRVNHAYLFSGPRGCGKTSSARIMARSINCVQGPTPDPCGVCESCVALAPNGPGSLDVTEMDAASHGTVDEARELRDRAQYAPVSSRYRVFIIDEAHMVTTAAFNALLKVVEEPPDHLIFVFATTEPEKVLTTIRSRTHHYPFRLLPPSTLRGLLERICAEEGVHVEPAVYPLVVRAGGGSARDSLSVLDQLLAGAGDEGITYARAVGLLGVTDVALLDDVLDALGAQDGAAVFGAVDRLVEAGHDPRRFASDLLQRLRDLILVHAVPDAGEKGLVDVPADEMERMVDQAGRLGPAALARHAELVHTALTEMRGATAPRLLLELVCARMLLPAASSADAAMIQRLEGVERRLQVGDAQRSGEHAERAAGPSGSAPADGSTFVRPSRRSSSEAGPGTEAPSRADDLAATVAPPTHRTPATVDSHDHQLGAEQPAAGRVASSASSSSSSSSGPARGGPGRSRGGDQPSDRSSSGPSADDQAWADQERGGPATEQSRDGRARDGQQASARPSSERPRADRAGDAARPSTEHPAAASARADDSWPEATRTEADRPTPASEPVEEAAPATATGAMDATGLRRIWSEVMKEVRENNKPTHALLQNATVTEVTGTRVVLAMPTPPLAKQLNQPNRANHVIAALGRVLSGDWTIEAVHGTDAGSGGAGGRGDGGARTGGRPEPPPRQPPRQPRTIERPSQVAARAAADAAAPDADRPTDDRRSDERPAGPRPFGDHATDDPAGADTSAGGGPDAPRRPGPSSESGDIPPPPEPPEEEVTEEDMYAEAAAEATGGERSPRVDPEEAVMELLSQQLGARRVEGR